jgi:pentalenic acid synthase
MAASPVRYPILEHQPQVLRELRQLAPVARVSLWDGRLAWLVTRYAIVRQALADPRLSTDATDPNFPSLNPNQVVPNYRGGLPRIDQDRHREIRSMLASKFTIRAARRWRAVSERIVAEQLAELLRGGPRADLVDTFALPVPLRLVCKLLGVAERDVGYVRHHAQMIITRAQESSWPSLSQLHDFADQLVRRSEADPGADLIGQLVREQLRVGAITRDELTDLSLILLVAGHTTTATTIGLSVLSLLEQPERYRALHGHPALVNPTVEEFLRFQTIVSDGAPRVAKRDLVLGGVTIRAGDAVVISLTAANRDEEVFTDPDAFHPHRADIRQHVAFGGGAHRCLGQHIARMELQVALAALTRTIPTLHLAVPLEQIRHSYRERHLNQIRELPVAW